MRWAIVGVGLNVLGMLYTYSSVTRLRGSCGIIAELHRRQPIWTMAHDAAPGYPSQRRPTDDSDSPTGDGDGSTGHERDSFRSCSGFPVATEPICAAAHIGSCTKPLTAFG